MAHPNSSMRNVKEAKKERGEQMEQGVVQNEGQH
jgi:hypothetical protein